MEDDREEQDRTKNKRTKARVIGKVIAGVLMFLSCVFVISALTIGACMLVVYFGELIGGLLTELILATAVAVMVIAEIRGN